MTSDAMKAVSQALRAARRQGPTPSVAELRRGMEQMQSSLPLPADVRTTDVDLGGVTARWFETPDADVGRVVLYFHGGGYALGSTATHGELIGRIARATGARVLGLDYRLAPEHPFPAAVDDAVAAYDWLLQQGFAPTRILLGGDSAGGGLALAALVALRDRATPLPAGAFLLSPWTDLTLSGASVRTRADADPMIRAEFLASLAAHYTGRVAADHPLISPLFADHARLPPVLIHVGDDEVLLDDATRLAKRAEAVGVAVEIRVWPGAFHVFPMFPQTPEAEQALSSIAVFCRARFGT